MKCIFCQNSAQYNHFYKDYYCQLCRCFMVYQENELLSFSIDCENDFININLKTNITSINEEDLHFTIPITTNSVNDYYHLVMNKFNKLRIFI